MVGQLINSLINHQGWHLGACWCPSPNYNARPAGASISLLVVHNISLPPNQFGGDQVESFFCNQLNCDEHPYFDQLRNLKVSAHFFIKRTGELLQFVSCNDRAWHAGKSVFNGQPDCNDYSIGVELEGADHIQYTDAQYQQLNQLGADLRNHYTTLSHCTGHSDIAPGRKSDPGAAFKWERLAWPS